MSREYAQKELKEELYYLFEQYYKDEYKDENAAKLAFVCDLSDYVSFYMTPDEQEATK